VLLPDLIQVRIPSQATTQATERWGNRAPEGRWGHEDPEERWDHRAAKGREAIKV